MKNRLKTFLAQYWPYVVVGFAVMAPLLGPGYVLTMDMVFTPHPPIPSEINASYPFYVVLHYVSYLVPGDILQKIILLTILVASGIGLHRLLRDMPRANLSKTAIVGASLFYMTSAFVYERFMMGQFAVVAGYAMLPFFTRALQQFLSKPTWRRVWAVSVWVIATSVMSIHTLVPMAILGVVMMLVERKNWRKFLGKASAAIAGITLVWSYWIIPAIAGKNLIGSALSGGDLQGFATQGGLFALLRLQGFWAEHRDLFLMPQQISPLPGIWQTLVWIAVTAGLVYAWRHQRKIALIYGSIIVVACLIALIGLGGAYREPHKIIVLAALGMSVLGAFGAHVWIERGKARRPSRTKARGFVVYAVPVLLGLGMMWGFWGQLSPRGYPAEWYALNKKMQTLPDKKPVAFVPWHLYQRYSFSPRIVANPAPVFFEGRKIITNNDPEFAGVRPLKQDAMAESVGRLLAEKPDNIAERLQQLGVGYVIFAREPGYEDYEFLQQTAGVQQIFQQGRLTLYRIGESS